MAQLYTASDIVVEAEQLTPGNVEYVAHWCGGHRVEEMDALDESKKYVALNVRTPNGPRRAQENDYIVKFPAGFFQVISSYTFHKNYTRQYD